MVHLNISMHFRDISLFLFPERGLSLAFPRMTHKKFGKLNSLCTLELG